MKTHHVLESGGAVKKGPSVGAILKLKFNERKSHLIEGEGAQLNAHDHSTNPVSKRREMKLREASNSSMVGLGCRYCPHVH